MKYSLCITTCNRYELLLESFALVLEDDRIDEIIIVDDHSTPDIRQRVGLLDRLNDKIKVFFQPINRGMSRNKADAISYASNEWCILFDSDNIIDKRYLDAIPDELEGDVIYCPSFAEPHFDYREFENLLFYKNIIGQYINKKNFEPLLNTCNYLVNRDAYLNVYKENTAMKGTDTIWFAYNWLKRSGNFYIVPGMRYFHRVHDGSGFMADVKYNMVMAGKVKQLIERL